MREFAFSLREQQGTGYGPVIGSYVADSGVPPDDGTLIEVKGKLMRIVAVHQGTTGHLKNTLLVEPYADPG